MNSLLRVVMLCCLIYAVAAETIHPRIIDVHATQARVYVFSQEPQQLSLHYQIKDDKQSMSIHGSGKHQHLFALHDLQAAQTYQYTITKKTEVIASGQFKTPAMYQQEISMCLFGQAAQPHISVSLQKKLLRALQAERTDFYVYTGALFNDVPDDLMSEDWNSQFYKPYASLMAQHKTVFLTHANDKQTGLNALRMHLPEIDHRQMEVVQRGPLAFMSVSSSLEPFGVFIKNLEQVLKQQSFARWRCLNIFPCMPMRGHTIWNVAQHKQFNDLLMRYKVDVVISASEQQYLRYKPLKQGNHACLFINTALGMQPARKADKRIAALQERDPHYVLLRINNDALEIVCKGLDQNIYDRFYMKRDRYQAYLDTAIPSDAWR